MLIAKLQVVSSELDNWKHGCNPDTYEITHYDLEFYAENEQNLIEKMTAYFLCDSSYFVFNSCEENGRIDVQLQTKEIFDSFPIGKNDFEAFQRGEIDAYLTTFVFQVYEQTIYTLKTRSV